MDTAARVVVGLIALIMLLYGLGFWFRTDAMNQQFALATRNDLGFASIRADVAGFFLSVGLFSAVAAWMRCGLAALGAATLFIFAFVGRTISLVVDGPVAGGVPPMVFEAVSATILLWARHLWQGDVSPTEQIIDGRGDN